MGPLSQHQGVRQANSILASSSSQRQDSIILYLILILSYM